MQITHEFTSPKADGTDSTLVKPSNWNAPHNVISAADGVVIGRPAGAGPGVMSEVPMSSVFPPGFMTMYGGATAPPGWLLCDGASYLRADQPGLFTAIGTVWGAADSSHFSVPDMRGRVPAGVDGGAGRLPGWALGTAGGIYQVSAPVYGNVQTYGEQDGIYIGGTTGGESHGVNGLAFGGGGYAADGHTHGITIGPFNVGFTANGGIVNNGNNVASPISTIQPTACVNFIIKT